MPVGNKQKSISCLQDKVQAELQIVHANWRQTTVIIPWSEKVFDTPDEVILTLRTIYINLCGFITDKNDLMDNITLDI